MSLLILVLTNICYQLCLVEPTHVGFIGYSCYTETNFEEAFNYIYCKENNRKQIHLSLKQFKVVSIVNNLIDSTVFCFCFVLFFQHLLCGHNPA